MFVRSVLSQSVKDHFYLINVQYSNVYHDYVYSRGFQTVIYWTLVWVLYVSILCVYVCIYIYLFIYWDFHSTHCFGLYKNSSATCFGNKHHHQVVLIFTNIKSKMNKIKTITYVIYN
jgi:hypothetical protein